MTSETGQTPGWTLESAMYVSLVLVWVSAVAVSAITGSWIIALYAAAASGLAGPAAVVSSAVCDGWRRHRAGRQENAPG
jgi:hypothetical protein